MAPTDQTSPSSDEAVRLVSLRDTPLSVDEVLDALGEEADGGVTLFVGRVRDHDSARAVTALEYSAHPTAADRLREVCAEVAQRHREAGVHAVAAVHRVGLLHIGDIAVVVGASAAHRDASFTAARDLIDTLKEQVPVWKHQRFADGTDEWVAHA